MLVSISGCRSTYEACLLKVHHFGSFNKNNQSVAVCGYVSAVNLFERHLQLHISKKSAAFRAAPLLFQC